MRAPLPLPPLLLLPLLPLLAMAPAQDPAQAPAQDRPGDPRAAPGTAADRGSASGPWAPHLRRDPAEQLRLSNSPAFRAFRQSWGGYGAWAARWDPRDGTPRFLYAPGPPLDRAADLAADLARLAGADPSGLRFAQDRTVGDLRVLRWDRFHRGARVEGDYVAILSRRGRIGGAWVSLGRMPDLRPLPGEIIARLPPRGIYAAVTAADEGPWRVWRDRDGDEVHRYDTRLFSEVSVDAEARSPGDPLITAPARQILLRQSDGLTQYTSDLGEHALRGPLEAVLEGPALRILDNGRMISAAGEDSFTLADPAIPPAAASVLHHYHVARDWLARYLPAHPLIGMEVVATVGMGPTCNAFYTSGTINFFSEVPGQCYEFGRSADVIYHETGHGIHHYAIASGTFATDVSEGSADYVAATILDDPTLVPDAFGPGTWIRELDTDKVYPQDIIFEPHNDGLIWGSFLWNLRAQWQATYGQAAGVEMTDRILLGALAQGPTLTDLAEAVLVADDDDGDLSNSVPHGCELLDLLAQHGLSPGPIGAVVFDHDPLGPQSSYVDGYDLDFGLYALPLECNALDEGSVTVWYATDGSVPDLSGASPSWASVPATFDGSRWTARLPRQFPGTRVRYLIAAWSDDGASYAGTWDGREETLYSFYVGDRREVWCEDFEGGLNGWTHGGGASTAVNGPWRDEWEAGVPAGGGLWDPATSASGSAHLATVLDGDYTPDNAQFIQSPAVNVSGRGPMLLLSYYRHLTVEDATYDHARLLINGATAWENDASPAGNVAHLDPAWTLHDLPLEGLADAAGDVRFTWELTSDAGLEYGGWQIDRVCVTELDDWLAHWRSHDLSATDDQPQVAITWSSPFMDPVVATRLVRRRDAPPADPADGEVVYEGASAPGQAHAFTDPDLLPGESAWYAVFTAPVTGNWYSEAVEGQNLDVGAVPPPADTGDTADTADSPADTAYSPADTGEPPDSDAPADPPDPKPEEGCGCAAGAGAGAWALLALPLVARRRRVS